MGIRQAVEPVSFRNADRPPATRPVPSSRPFFFGLAQQTDDLAADKVGQTGLEEGLANDHQTHEEHDGGVAELGVGAAGIDNAGGGQCCGDGCAEDDQRDLLRDQQDHGDHKDDAGNDRLCCHNSDTSKMNCTICAVVFQDILLSICKDNLST